MAMSPSEAAAAGLGWVPEDHPLYGTKGYAGYQGDSGGSGGTQTSAPGDGFRPISTTPAPAAATETPAQIAQSAATQSSTPGAAPTEATANQGTQDVVRNSWLQQATQSTQVDPNDPNIKQQVDPFAAQQERQRRDYESAAAERLSAAGAAGSGQMEQERRYGMEQAGQATGMFQSSLIASELQNKRSEIQDALTHLGDTISSDQKNALTQKLADLDAAIKREGIASTNKNAAMDDATKREAIAAVSVSASVRST
jgi:hypothetical protein